MKSLIFLISAIFLVSCADKKEIIYKEVKVPVKCQIKMPLKPKNNGDFQSYKELLIYFKKCEKGLLYCSGNLNETSL